MSDKKLNVLCKLQQPRILFKSLFDTQYLNIANLKFKLKTAHSLHHQNIQTLEIGLFKIHHGFSKVYFLDLFHNYNQNKFSSFRSQPDTLHVRTIFCTINL